METPTLIDPRSDPDRLDAARGTGRLAPMADAALDALAQRVATALHVPAAFVSLIDEARDVYPGQAGFGSPLDADRELSGRTFCHLTLAAGAAVVIDDTHLEAEHRAIPTVETLGVRAYLGIPLMVGPHMVGSLCAIDVRPHAWSETDIDLMLELAGEAMQLLASR